MYMATFADLKKDFQKLIISGRLGQAYMIFGHGASAEKLQFARELAAYLETKNWQITPRVLNDSLIVNAGKNGGIDLIRETSAFLWQKPAVSNRRVLIIDQAEELTGQAQNAILKISEEPPAHALILLLVKNYESLLPTIQSRFQKIYARENSESELSSSKQIRFKIPTKESLKELVEDDRKLENFIAGLMIELRRDKIKNWKALKELLNRWSMIKQFNVNKKLQLEAVWTKLSV